jgi:predicted nuclease of predicted toxin-antitoxin system
MRVLLDECLPKRLKRLLAGHSVQTVPEAGWAGKKNGELIRLATGKFDAFITIDKNLVYQQSLRDLSFGVVVLSARSNRFADLEPLLPGILAALDTLRPNEVTRVRGSTLGSRPPWDRLSEPVPGTW